MINKVLIILVKIYQYTISPMLIASCRFTPTCSNYALQALKKYNIVKALGLITKRLSKCHPFSKHSGYDPLK